MVEQTSSKEYSYTNSESSNTDPFVELMELFQSVKTDTPEAILNETTMVNSRGERIKY